MTVPTQEDQTPEAVMAEPVVAEPVVTEPVLVAEPVAIPEPVITIPVADKAPLVSVPVEEPKQDRQAPTAGDGANQLLGLPLQLVNQLLAKLGATPLQSLAELMPAVRIVTLLVVAGIGVKLTGATLGAINDLPLLGRLLELAGLISALNFLARNAIRSQKRAELLARILKLKRDLLG